MDVDRVRALVDSGDEHLFYCSSSWQRARAKALRRDHNECRLCAARGRVEAATMVHHVKHLKDRPDLALALDDPETGEAQLISLCKACHEEQHPERMRTMAKPAEPVTAERWD